MGLSRTAKLWQMTEAGVKEMSDLGFDPKSPLCEFSLEWPLDLHAFRDAMFASSAVPPLAVALDAWVVNRQGLLMVVPEVMQTLFEPADTRLGILDFPDWYIRARVLQDGEWRENAPVVHLNCLVEKGPEGRRWAREGISQFSPGKSP